MLPPLVSIQYEIPAGPATFFLSPLSMPRTRWWIITNVHSGILLSLSSICAAHLFPHRGLVPPPPPKEWSHNDRTLSINRFRNTPRFSTCLWAGRLTDRQAPATRFRIHSQQRDRRRLNSGWTTNRVVPYTATRTTRVECRPDAEPGPCHAAREPERYNHRRLARNRTGGIPKSQALGNSALRDQVKDLSSRRTVYGCVLTSEPNRLRINGMTDLARCSAERCNIKDHNRTGIGIL